MDNKMDLENKKIELIKAYKELLDLEIITEEEFAFTKKRILNNIIDNSKNVDNNDSKVTASVDASQNVGNSGATFIPSSDNIKSKDNVNPVIDENKNNVIKDNVNTNETSNNIKEASTPIKISKAFLIINIILVLLTLASLINGIFLRYDYAYAYQDYNTGRYISYSYNSILLAQAEAVPFTICFIVFSVCLVVTSILISLKQEKIKLYLLASILSIIIVGMYIFAFIYWDYVSNLEGPAIAGSIVMLIVSLAYIAEFILLRKKLANNNVIKEASTPKTISNSFKIMNIVLLVVGVLSSINVALLNNDYVDTYYSYYDNRYYTYYGSDLLITGRPYDELTAFSVLFLLFSLGLIITSIFIIKMKNNKLNLLASLLSFAIVIMYVLAIIICQDGLYLTCILGSIVMLGVAIAYMVEFIKKRKK